MRTEKSEVSEVRSPPTQLRDYHDVPFPEGTQPNPDPLNEIAEKCGKEIRYRATNPHDKSFSWELDFEGLIIPVITRALQEARKMILVQQMTDIRDELAEALEDVPRGTIAQLRQEKEAVKRIVEDTANAYGKALIRERELRQQLEDNWSCKQKVIAQQTQTIRELNTKLQQMMKLIIGLRFWLEGSLNCKSHTWEPDQREYAQQVVNEAIDQEGKDETNKSL